MEPPRFRASRAAARGLRHFESNDSFLGDPAARNVELGSESVHEESSRQDHKVILTLSKQDKPFSLSAVSHSILNVTRGEDLHTDDSVAMMRLATIGGMDPLLREEPRALAGRLAATVLVVRLSMRLLLNTPFLACPSSERSDVAPIRADGGNDKSDRRHSLCFSSLAGSFFNSPVTPRLSLLKSARRDFKKKVLDCSQRLKLRITLLMILCGWIGDIK